MSSIRGVNFVLRGAAIVGALAISGAVLSACGSDSKSNTDSTPGAQTQVIDITVTNKGCPSPTSEIAAGQTKFQLKNDGGTKVSEVELMQGGKILGEKEGLAAGFSGSFTVDLKPGDYELYCPNADTERSPLKVTSAATAAAGS